MSTNKCPDHRLSTAGLKKFFSGRTSKRLECPYPRCKSVVGKYDYKYRKEESDAVDYRAVPVKQSLLATLKLRLKNLLNVAKTDSMRDMLQGLLYDGKVSSDVRAGEATVSSFGCKWNYSQFFCTGGTRARAYRICNSANLKLEKFVYLAGYESCKKL